MDEHSLNKHLGDSHRKYYVLPVRNKRMSGLGSSAQTSFFFDKKRLIFLEQLITQKNEIYFIDTIGALPNPG